MHGHGQETCARGFFLSPRHWGAVAVAFQEELGRWHVGLWGSSGAWAGGYEMLDNGALLRAWLR